MVNARRLLGSCCAAILVGGLAWAQTSIDPARAQTSIDPAWAQVPMDGNWPPLHVFYGGRQYPYRPAPGERGVDLSRAIYQANWGDDVRDLTGTEALYISTGQILEVQLSPANGYLALREVVGGGEGAQQLRLSILDRSGDVVRSVDSVREFVWSPTGEQIAYITGTPYEGGLGFVSTGTSVLDMETLETSQVYPDGGWSLEWAAWDRNLYIWDLRRGREPQVMRYDPVSDNVEETSYHGIHFSPDGQWYYEPAKEGEPFRLFTASGERELPFSDWGADTGAFLRSREMRYAQPRGWLDNRTLLVPSQQSDGSVREYLYDVDADTCHLVDGVVVGVGDRELLVLGPGEETKAIAVETLRRCPT